MGWQTPPTQKAHLQILQNSYRAFIAVDTTCNQVVGFVTAISDGVLSAYIPLLEVAAPYQGKGIGTRLLQLVLDECKNFYMVDICHDQGLASYYAKFGALKSHASIFRNR